MTSQFLKKFYTKCRFHNSANIKLSITDSEIFALLSLTYQYLDWDLEDNEIDKIAIPSDDYYHIKLEWFEGLNLPKVTADEVKRIIQIGLDKNDDFYLFFDNLIMLHQKRRKYRKILSSQPIPNMNQIGPRVLLEFGLCDIDLLANWMLWRKWIYDIDNRSAQETGYVFEPVLAGCLGGESMSASASPIKRIKSDGSIDTKGRQVDCLVADSNTAYELKLRVTIAASGQGRFKEELSFPVEAKKAGFTPVLLVLDPTSCSRLDELSQKFIEYEGEFYHGEDAWFHMEQAAGDIMSIYIDKFIKPAILHVESMSLDELQNLKLEWNSQSVKISNETHEYSISRD